MKRRTWGKTVRGWWLGATIGQMWGLGATWFGRYNGVAIYLGPLCIDIQPPAPAWARG